MLAALTQTPELIMMFDDAQSKRLAAALADVSRHYQLPAINPKHMALGVLFWTAGSIYLPMGKAIAERKNSHETVSTKPAQSTPMPQSGQNVTAGPWFVPPDANTLN